MYPQGGPKLSISFNPGNNIIDTQGFTNDAVGNISSDGTNSYSYDAEGNLTGVGVGTSAHYYYDSLNQRVQIAPSRGTYEFLWDIFGRRVSTWSATSHSFVESNAYSDSGPVAIRSVVSRDYEAQNWLGTERVRTTYNGAVAQSFSSLPWGDALTPSGDNGDQHDFELMDRDVEDNTEHAQYRQYSTNLGRWFSPDSYSGSYDFKNPQSFNRYSYAANDPANIIDPSGQDGIDPTGGVGGVGGCLGAAISEGANPIADLSCGLSLFEALESLFGASRFHGTLKPRPTNTAGWDGNFGESLGIPTTIPRGNLGLGMALGLPQQGCEFGACGPGASTFSQGPGAIALGGAATIGCVLAEPCGAVEGILAGIAVIGTAIGVQDVISQISNHDTDFSYDPSCHAQYVKDVAYCKKLPRPETRAACYAQAAERLANCNAGRSTPPLPF